MTGRDVSGDTLEVAVFGPTIVRSDGLPISLSPREREVLTAIAIEHPRATTLDGLIGAIWPHDPPVTARQVVQNNISGLRRRFGGSSIITEARSNYRLGPAWSLDIDRFARHLGAAHRAALADDHRAEFAHLRRALEVVRGDPFDDLAAGVAVDASRARNRQLLLTAQEDAVLAELPVGRTGC